MVKGITIGIIGIQGAIIEHVKIMEKVLNSEEIFGNVKIIKKKSEIDEIDGLIIPGGESSTISKLLFKSSLFKPILKRIKERF